MTLHEWYYLFVAGMVSTIFQFFWIKKLKSKDMRSAQSLLILFVSSFAIAWGIDVIQKELDIFKFIHIIKISLGCWLMIAVASGAKLQYINGWNRKNFLIEYGGELISYLLIGTVVYVLT